MAALTDGDDYDASETSENVFGVPPCDPDESMLSFRPSCDRHRQSRTPWCAKKRPGRSRPSSLLIYHVFALFRKVWILEDVCQSTHESLALVYLVLRMVSQGLLRTIQQSSLRGNPPLVSRSKYVEAITESILKLQKSQEIEEIRRYWWRRYNITTPCSELNPAKSTDTSSLGVGQVGGCFVMLFVGMVMALLVSFLELIYRVRKRLGRNKEWVDLVVTTWSCCQGDTIERTLSEILCHSNYHNSQHQSVELAEDFGRSGLYPGEVIERSLLAVKSR
ncbi:unnamed protein product [Protopolystoma xenopodis]|uniref:Uncharacterized protein n=1 Tax=Protopolystoma xenopodis TaxID=117903 RepID=A0A3S5CBC1_9PLAT|nr:unnamed protein product [Protopolystoma xenopodis]